ncbi:hypothetical protein J1614_009295 [Plenodomus biglobosus]|nr:hypothetical protein J1614_009295 [Plenodomus biglobosus]
MKPSPSQPQNKNISPRGNVDEYWSFEEVGYGIRALSGHLAGIRANLSWEIIQAGLKAYGNFKLVREDFQKVARRTSNVATW